MCFIKGTFSLDSIEFKTRGEKAEAPETTKLTGDWMNRKLKLMVILQDMYILITKVLKGADEFLKKVFVGYQGATTGATTAPTNVEATGNTNSATVNAQ